MNSLAILIVGLYMVFVGWHGNAGAATSYIAGQKKFLPWLVAVLVLFGLYQIQVLKPAVKGIAVLALVAIVLKQWPVITASLKQLETGQTGNQSSPTGSIG